MDIRIARTDRAIEQAFMELREKNPLEKIKIKDLCAMACINKSTFYAHYEDIYALANALENKLIESILASVPRTNDSVALHQAETLTRELFHAFMQNQRAVNILFSGSRQGIFANSIEKGLRQRFEEADPTFAADLNRGILLSFCVQGCFYAFANNSSRMDESKLVELLGAGEVVDGVIDVDNTNYQPTRIHLDADWTNRFLGTDIPKEQMVKILTDLQFQMEGDEIIVPSFRSDVEHKADIAEEIARFYGYNNIPTTIAKGSPEGGYNEYQKFERVVNQNMLAQGMYEIMTYSFVSPKQYDKIRLPKDDPKRQSVVIRNPLGEDTSIMRTNAIPSMMDILSKNYNNRNGAVSLYEIGNEYIPVEGELLPDEVPNLVLGMYGDDKDFFTLKGVVENLLDTLAIREYDVDAKSDDPTFHPGRCAVLSKDGEEFGIIGEVHPLVCANYGINTRVYVGKLKLRKLFAMMDTQRSYVPMPKFPASTRDLALLCDDALPVMTMEKAIKAAAGKILEKIELFDVYKGSQIAQGKKSVAFNISMRASDRTLTDEEVNGAMSKILKALEELGAQIRS